MNDKEITAICPGSCGELIQGIINGRELLVPYPIDLYSMITIRAAKTALSANFHSMPYYKLRQAIIATLKHLEIPLQEAFELEIIRHSFLPVGKGLSSSTADIGAAILAVSTFFDRKISLGEITAIAAGIEPTDGIFYDGLVLFDPSKGQVIENLGPVPPLKVLVLEGVGYVDTVWFHRQRPRMALVDRAYDLLRRSLSKGDWKGIGQAAIFSAISHQAVLPKPHLKEIIDIALKAGAYGINVAHSGTAVGIILDKEHDEKRLVELLEQAGLLVHYGRHYIVHMIQGGPHLL